MLESRATSLRESMEESIIGQLTLINTIEKFKIEEDSKVPNPKTKFAREVAAVLNDPEPKNQVELNNQLKLFRSSPRDYILNYLYNSDLNFIYLRVHALAHLGLKQELFKDVKTIASLIVGPLLEITPERSNALSPEHSEMDFIASGIEGATSLVASCTKWGRRAIYTAGAAVLFVGVPYVIKNGLSEGAADSLLNAFKLQS